MNVRGDYNAVYLCLILVQNATWVLNSLKVYDKRKLQGRTDSASSFLPSRDAALAAAAVALLAV